VVVSVWISRYYTCNSLLEAGAVKCKELEPMVTPIHVHNEALVAGLAIALLAAIRPHYFARKPTDGFSWRGFVVSLVACSIAAVLYVFDKTIFCFTALALIFGSITLWFLWDRSVFSRPAAWRLWYPVSRLSYGMYLNHFLLFPSITGWVVKAVIALTGSSTVASYAGIVAGILVSMILAAFTFVLVERPFLLLRSRWLSNREPAIAQIPNTEAIW
jgi:peptidoglycan/LPS O-acetylase OafA/YrhL